MRFLIKADRRMVVVFEPTAAEYVMEPGKNIAVEWLGDSEDGMVSFEAEDFVVHAPSGGYSKAWDSEGIEIYIGPESGPDVGSPSQPSHPTRPPAQTSAPREHRAGGWYQADGACHRGAG
ncbi:hypothetical protein [Actinacidiphila glaucinigra]|uniref:hypothetical protein n=1 Tax=Actinacidiphila glaucinigra TaxID=235986 RepID=UPI0035D72074